METKLFLGIDTCTKWLNIALLDIDEVPLAVLREEVTTHATRLQTGIEEVLARADVAFSAIAAMGVVVGPGSFTGIRIGLASVLGLSTATGTPVYGLSSLAALSRSCDEEGEGIALLDARRSEVYAQRFFKGPDGMEAIGPASSTAPARLLEKGDPPRWAIGDGVVLVPGWPPSCRLHASIPNLGLPAAAEARSAFLAGREAETPRPLYVRAPDARKPKSS